MNMNIGNIHPDIAAKIDKMVSRGTYEAKFGHLPHAQYMATKLQERNITATILEKFGHAATMDTAKHLKLAKHYHVLPTAKTGNTAHRILGKFV